MDGAANDGRPGEGDNVVNVEKIASHVSGTLSGSAGDDELTVWANIDEGNSTLLGNGGNDKLTAGDYQDNLDGGPGNDVLNAGFGNDTLTGGPGQDTIFADATSASCGWYSYTCKIPFGNDIVYARDGEADTIDCGVGEDTAYVDAIDTVANCETVDKAGAGTPSGPAGPGTTAGPKATVTGKLSIKAIAKQGLGVTVPCASACKVTVSLVVKRKSVGSAKKTLLEAGDAKLTVKVAQKPMKAFKKLRKASATLKVTVEDAAGKTSSTKPVSLRK
jgi:Ca2+-binding RTX toxin-like protein